MAHHDLRFVKQVSTAERAVLSLACRQLAYKAAKMGREEVVTAVGVKAEEEVAGGDEEEEVRAGKALARLATEAALSCPGPATPGR